jgi:hypothetical protein
VCDLRGEGHVLTDPAIHILDPERFKLADTNLGKEGSSSSSPHISATKSVNSSRSRAKPYG